ncbi:PadR family transcriptional regulator [Natrinema versiforme]|uniref:Transcriptional regulator PadR family protein n=1 Tax=Natrinema versiforme JCM 10478 TaxID=1227496 RepID=L9XTJ2_9EURY|nr:PadR family transcriptional regulator [Natrinema versiforme]ELY64716.1 transcriptional regulator PadR family protein [Natrinema versiforme JCM 10478]
MYDDNSRGLESPDTTDVSTASDQRLVADGGTTWGDLTGFQRDTLAAIARLERDAETSYGLAIKRRLEREYGEVNHGRLYTNLDDLADDGLVEKSALDKRTNEYVLTDSGRALLIQRVERLVDACEIGIATTDGSGMGDRA